MRRPLVVLTCMLVLAHPLAFAADPDAPAPREGADHAVPLYGELLRVYDAPANPFAAGHRGVDVGAGEGTPVRASADGVVSFAGSVAGNLAVTVDHGGGLVTTYSFLGSAVVGAGDAVAQGTIVGTVGRGHAIEGMPPHVHLSARRDGVYFDPLVLYVGSSYADLLSLTG